MIILKKKMNASKSFAPGQETEEENDYTKEEDSGKEEDSEKKEMMLMRGHRNRY